jgi:hypothetical protein
MSQRNAGKIYPDLMDATRQKLIGSKIPYIIENTPGAPMRVDIILCGSMFGLRLIRHRWFELSFPAFSLVTPCRHDRNPVCVVGHGTPSWARKNNGGKRHTIKEWHDAMGVDWMNRDELALAIPPAYSEFLGKMAVEYLSKNHETVKNRSEMRVCL